MCCWKNELKKELKVNKKFNLLFLFFILFTNISFGAGFKNKLFLTYEETIWIKKTKVVTIAVPKGEKPFSYLENGKYVGYNVDILNKIFELTRLKFHIQGYENKYLETAFATTGAIVFKNKELNTFVTDKIFKSDFQIAISPENEMLYNIINKSLKKISQNDYKKIYNKWFGNELNKEKRVVSSELITNLNLTIDEKNWLKKNPVLKMAVMNYWPIDEDGSNIHYRLIDLIKKYSNLDIVPITFNNWNSGYNQALNGTNIYGIFGLSWSKLRENNFFYTPTYDFSPCYLVTKNDNKTIKSLNDIKNKTIYLKKDAITHEIIKKIDNVKFIDNNSVEEMSKNLSVKDEASAFLSYFVDFTELKKNNLKVVDTIYEKYGEVSLGINKKHPELYSILMKAYKVIPKNELSNLRAQGKLTLTDSEKEWLNKNIPVKYIFNPDLRPIEWKNDLDEHMGIVSDILKLIQAKTNINLQNANLKYTNSYDMIKNIQNKKAMMITAINENKKNKELLNFTKNHLISTPYVFVSKKEFTYTNGFDDTVNKKIGVIENDSVIKMIKDIKPNIKLSENKDIEDAFKRLNDGELDLLILNALSAQYYIKALEYEDLYIAYKTLFNLNLKIALDKSIPNEVISILDKSLQIITEKEKSDIIHKWTNIKLKAKTDWAFIGKIAAGILIIIALLFINNRNLKKLVEDKTSDIQTQKKELENILGSFDKNVIFSKTDLKGNITQVSKAFCEISGYKEEELIGQPHNIVRHPDMSPTVFAMIWKSLKREIPIVKEIKNLRKNGTFYWVQSRFAPDYDSNGVLIGYQAIRHDITDKKEVEELKDNLEIKVEERTFELEETKKEIEKILESMFTPVLITDKEKRDIRYANKYAELQYETTRSKMIGESIEKIYTSQEDSNELRDMMIKHGKIENVEHDFVTNTGKEFTALLSVMPIKYKNRESYIGMTTDITTQKEMEREIRTIHKHTRDSIEYASLIQHALVPDNTLFANFFDDYFAYWRPKDIVGGDIYLFEPINDNECLIFCIDCTGHGVPGAFVTMLVKAIERQVSAIIHAEESMDISPAWILSYFNKTIKKLLKQESEDSISNAGFDGGILYYNKQTNIVKFSGAETPLFMFNEDGEFKTVKGSRHSVGYKKSDANYEFKEQVFEVKPGMQFYMTTDGYLDQNGGEKDFPYGKKRFGKMLEEHYTKPYNEQEKIYIKELLKYQVNDLSIEEKIDNIIKNDIGDVQDSENIKNNIKEIIISQIDKNIDEEEIFNKIEEDIVPLVDKEIETKDIKDKIKEIVVKTKEARNDDVTVIGIKI
jgi:PAS domain S-box-containing protein